MHKTIAILSLLILATALSSCGLITTESNAGSSGASTGLAGVYNGSMTFDNFNEAFMAAYRSPSEKNSGATAEIARANEQATVNRRQIDIAGVKSLPKTGTISITIYKNASKSLADGDFMVGAIDNFSGYSRFLPRNDDQPYWALFKDKRRGDIVINLSSTVFQLENSIKGDSSKATMTFKLDGSISGKNIKGTWSQSWDGTEMYTGTFEATKTTATVGDR